MLEQQVARLERVAVDLLKVLHSVDELARAVDIDELERTALHGWETETKHGSDVTLGLELTKQNKTNIYN
jgi:hypothetical protein